MIKLDYGCFSFFTPIPGSLQLFPLFGAENSDAPRTWSPGVFNLWLPPPMWEFHAGVVLENNYHQSFILHIFIMGSIVVHRQTMGDDGDGAGADHVSYRYRQSSGMKQKVQMKLTVCLSAFVGSNWRWLLCERYEYKYICIRIFICFLRPCNSCSSAHMWRL